MRFLTNNSTDPHFNMAFDEWCLRNMDTAEPFFYLWQNAPSVIIGYNQNARAEVNIPFLESNGIRLARRVTGGGAVYHDLGNLNYSFIGHGADHSPIVDALRKLGADAQRTGRNDIFVDGRKVSGYAKSLFKNNVLIHGTLMYDVDIETLTRALDTPGSKLNRKGVASVRSRVANLREYLPQFESILEFRNALSDILSNGDPEMELPTGALEQIEKMAKEKFPNPDWIYREPR